MRTISREFPQISIRIAYIYIYICMVTCGNANTIKNHCLLVEIDRFRADAKQF